MEEILFFIFTTPIPSVCWYYKNENVWKDKEKVNICMSYFCFCSHFLGIISQIAVKAEIDEIDKIHVMVPTEGGCKI